MKPQNRLVEFANSSLAFLTCFLGWGGVGGMMTTVLRKQPEQYLQMSRFTRYLQYFRDVGPSFVVTKPTSGLCELDLGISEDLRQKLEVGWGGKLFSVIITTLFRRHPDQYHHALARTHHAPLQKQTLLRRGLGFTGVAEPLPHAAGIFDFNVKKMFRFRFWEC